MTSPLTHLVPDAVIETVARAIYDRWRLRSGESWEQTDPVNRKYWLGWGRSALTAALHAGHMEQEWRAVLSWGPDHVRKRDTLCLTRDSALRHVELTHNKQVILANGTPAATTAWAETRFVVTFTNGSQWTSAWQEVTEDATIEPV